MLNKFCSIFSYVILALINSIHAQEIKYKESAALGYTRFFYDQNYFLVDKNCAFKSIERLAKYDSINLNFDGEFKDFDRNGRMILTGTYKDGLKHGAFKSYHPNGKLKWETTFINNLETGEWKYYYPDGKPMLTLVFSDDETKFMQFWNSYGEQKIKDGQGEYTMKFPIIGFTDHGYTTYVRKGKVSNGKPVGNWLTSFITNEKNGTTAYIFSEEFHNGIKTDVYKNPDYTGYFIPEVDFLYVPSQFMERAEYFLTHDCTFDDFSGFKNYTFRKFNAYLGDVEFDNTPLSFQFKVQYNVNTDGIPRKMSVVESPEELPRSVIKIISDLFQTVPYIIPSIAENIPIDDTVTFTGDFIILEGKGSLQNLKIERERGQ